MLKIINIIPLMNKKKSPKAPLIIAVIFYCINLKIM